jgi:hypothetical protein
MAESVRAGVQVVTVPHLIPTPLDVARQVVELAEILPGMSVLEPSAGTGSIIKAIHDAVEGVGRAVLDTAVLCGAGRGARPFPLGGSFMHTTYSPDDKKFRLSANWTRRGNVVLLREALSSAAASG